MFPAAATPSSSSSDDSDSSFFDEDELDHYCDALATSSRPEDDGMIGKKKGARGGSVKGKRYIERNMMEAHDAIVRNYLGTATKKPRYPEEKFQRDFRMSSRLFKRLLNDLEKWVGPDGIPYFKQRPNALGKLGASCLQKLTAVMRMLANGTSANACDEYCQISETLALQCMDYFCEAVFQLYGKEYLRSPTQADVARILRHSQDRGFPGMLGSIDCMHWQWKNCPVAWAGQYKGKEKKPTLVLEAVASYDLWFWHAYFGMPGSCNDINVLDRSPLLGTLFRHGAPQLPYLVGGEQRSQYYLLADGIYPKWSIFVQTISEPQGNKQKHFAKMQEACRKDIERAFGVLKARFGIIERPARYWTIWKVKNVMTTCIILHNMIVEDRRREVNAASSFVEGLAAGGHNAAGPLLSPPTVTENARADAEDGLTDIVEKMALAISRIEDQAEHYRLRELLIDHLWEVHGSITEA